MRGFRAGPAPAAAGIAALLVAAFACDSGSERAAEPPSGSTAAGSPAAGTPARPNLLLVSIDTLRSDHTSAYGYERDTTPVLDALAEAGARFEVFYAATATTGPSHATLFTGLSPLAHGVVKNGFVLRDEHATLAETLAAAGWQTAGFVSSAVLDARFGYGRGFASWDDEFEAATASIDEGGAAGLRAFRHVTGGEGLDRRAGATTDAALRWLRGERRPGEPFFLFVHYFDPHRPYEPPDGFVRRFAPEPGEDAAAREIRLYDEEIAYTDAELGRLVSWLDGSGLADDTLVVVTGDHGEGLMDHGAMMHGIHLYEEALRVPLVLRWPGRIPAGGVIASPAALADLAPTALDLLGVGPPDTSARGGPVPGRSLAAALLDGASLDPKHPVHFFRRHFLPIEGETGPVRGEGYGVRVGSWKYFEIPEEGKRELYDLARDPGERENLHERQRVMATALAAEVSRWRRLHGRAEPISGLDPESRRALEALGYTE